MDWTWVPDVDGTPDCPVTKPDSRTVSSANGKAATAPGDTGDGVSGQVGTNGTATDGVYSSADLSRWKPGQLKSLMSDLGLDASGCVEKRDIVDKIARHPGGLAAAASAAADRGDDICPISEKRGEGQESPAGDDGSRDACTLEMQPAENLRGMRVPALKKIMSAEGINSDGCLDKEDLIARIEDKRKRSSVLPVAAAADLEEQDDGLVGMTLADYMSRPPADSNDAENGPGRGRQDTPGGVGGGHVDPSVSDSGPGDRPGNSSAASGSRRVVRLAPAHIAPPSRPAPEWVVDMQVCGVPILQQRLRTVRLYPSYLPFYSAHCVNKSFCFGQCGDPLSCAWLGISVKISHCIFVDTTCNTKKIVMLSRRVLKHPTYRSPSSRPFTSTLVFTNREAQKRHHNAG